MASDISYGMGQIRYKNGVTYLEDLNFSAYGIETSSAAGTKKYQDIVLYNNNNLSEYFSTNASYYLRLGIPKNLSYDMIFDLRLLKGNIDSGDFAFNNRNQFQEVKRFIVPRDSFMGTFSSRVILYPNGGQDKDQPAVVAIAEETSEVNIGQVYYNQSEDKYYIKGTESDTEILYRNDILLNHSWIENFSNDIAYFDFVFSSKIASENFNCILLELYRHSYDDDTQWTDTDGTIYNGIHVDLNSIDVQCFKITNLIGNNIFDTRDVTTFNSIGVWSHPDAIMAINGEEIRIGQSGYYELNDFEITNFGIVVRGIQDRFSLDYQYKIT